MTSIDRIISGHRPADPALRRRVRKLVFKLFLRQAKEQHPFNSAPTWWGWRDGLVAQYPDGGVTGSSRLSNAYAALL